MDAGYFMDVMDFYELPLYLKHMSLSIKWDWERARQIMYSVIQVNAKHRIKPEQILSFDWDKQDKPHFQVNRQEAEKLAEKMKYNMEQMNSHNGG